MLSLLSSTVRRIPPLRWLWAIAVSLIACARAIPMQFRYTNKRLTLLKNWPKFERERVTRSWVKRWRKGQTRIRQHRRGVLGELPRFSCWANARKAYMEALKELNLRGHLVSRERRLALTRMASATAREIRKADVHARASIGPRHLRDGVVDAMAETRRAA